MATAKNGIRLNFYMKPSLVNEIDDYAETLGITRTAAINLICYQWSIGQKTLDGIINMANTQKNLTVSGDV